MDINLSSRQKEIIDIIRVTDNATISSIKDELSEDISIPTLNRELAHLVASGYIFRSGSGRSTSYSITTYFKLFAPIEADKYFNNDPDNRDAFTGFNFNIFDILTDTDIFSNEEMQHLDRLHRKYQDNISDIPDELYKKELERLTIELSWKSSQIEGNTYSLLETEILFLEKKMPDGKPKDDAVMLLNHKDALNYILKNKSIANKLDLRLIEEIHSIIVKDLGVSRNVRTRAVGITGTAYKPIDNEHQIRESLDNMCSLINSSENGFIKAFLAVILISYIQPFEDGNKRTARMISSALLIAYNACPLSYRNIDSMEYKKAMLLFFEQNNLFAFKKIFIEQNEFSANNYFA